MSSVTVVKGQEEGVEWWVCRTAGSGVWSCASGTEWPARNRDAELEVVRSETDGSMWRTRRRAVPSPPRTEKSGSREEQTSFSCRSQRRWRTGDGIHQLCASETDLLKDGAGEHPCRANRAIDKEYCDGGSYAVGTGWKAVVDLVRVQQS